MAAEDEEIVYVVADVPVDAVLAPGTAYTISGLDTHAPKITIGEGDAAKTISGALIETVYLGLAFSTTAKAYYYRDVEGTKDAPERTPWYCRAAWILQGITLPASFLIFVLYWKSQERNHASLP